MILPKSGYLEGLRALCDQYGVVLIFDEVRQAFVLLRAVQTLVNIQPDLTCLGKIIGGGMPVGAFAGAKTSWISGLTRPGVSGRNTVRQPCCDGRDCHLQLSQPGFYDALSATTGHLLPG